MVRYMSAEVEEFLEALFEEEEYVDVYPALRVLMRRNERVRRAVEYLKENKIKEAIQLFQEAGLKEDQIVYIISTILRKPLEEAEKIYTKEVREIRISYSDKIISKINLAYTYQLAVESIPRLPDSTDFVVKQHAWPKDTSFPVISWKDLAAG